MALIPCAICFVCRVRFYGTRAGLGGGETHNCEHGFHRPTISAPGREARASTAGSPQQLPKARAKIFSFARAIRTAPGHLPGANVIHGRV